MKNRNDNKFLRSVSIHLEQFNCFVTKKSFEIKFLQKIKYIILFELTQFRAVNKNPIGHLHLRSFSANNSPL